MRRVTALAPARARVTSPAAAVARHPVRSRGASGLPHAPAASHFFDRVKAGGANALLGAFLTTGVRFDRVLEGLTVTRVDAAAGEVHCELRVGPSLTNAYNTLHGGAVCTLVDVVGTMALLARDPTRPGVSVELSTSFTSPAPAGGLVTVVGRVLKEGRRLGFTQVDVYAEGGKLVASGRHTKAM